MSWLTESRDRGERARMCLRDGMSASNVDEGSGNHSRATIATHALSGVLTCRGERLRAWGLIMLACRELTELVTEYLEDQLSFGQRLRFEMHIGLCRHCRAYLRQMRHTIRTLGSLREDAIPEATATSTISHTRGVVAGSTGRIDRFGDSLACRLIVHGLMSEHGREKTLAKHDRSVPEDQHAPLQVQAHGSRKHLPFELGPFVRDRPLHPDG